MKYTLNDFNGAGYIFNPATKTITLSGMDILNKTNIFSIINATENKIIMQLNNPLLGIESLTNNNITLVYDTSSMNSNDELVFIFDFESNISAQAIEDESIRLLRRMVKLLESSATVDILNRQRVVVETIPTIYGGYNTGGGMTNQVTNGAPIMSPGVNYFLQTWAGPVDPRWTNIDQARLTYNQGIRSHLSFT